MVRLRARHVDHVCGRVDDHDEGLGSDHVGELVGVCAHNIVASRRGDDCAIGRGDSRVVAEQGNHVDVRDVHDVVFLINGALVVVPAGNWFYNV